MMTHHVLLVAVLLVGAEQTPAQFIVLQAFDAADTDAKNRHLNLIATQRLDASSEELAEILRHGLADSDAGVRERAALAVASRAGGPRFSKAEGVAARWLAEYQIMQDLRESVRNLLDDASPKVRLAAVLAIGNLDYDTTAGKAYMLKAGTIAALVNAAAKEKDSRVKGEIVKGLALGPDDSPEIRNLFVRCLSDDSPSVRRFAAVGSARLRPIDALGPLSHLLQDGDPAVRVEAAKALGNFDSQTNGLANALRDALALERNTLVKSELQRALTRVQTKQ